MGYRYLLDSGIRSHPDRTPVLMCPACGLVGANSLHFDKCPQKDALVGLPSKEEKLEIERLKDIISNQRDTLGKLNVSQRKVVTQLEFFKSRWKACLLCQLKRGLRGFRNTLSNCWFTWKGNRRLRKKFRGEPIRISLWRRFCVWWKQHYCGHLWRPAYQGKELVLYCPTCAKSRLIDEAEYYARYGTIPPVRKG